MGYQDTAVARTAAPQPAAVPGLDPYMGSLIAETASALGVPPVELASIISYETGGTMNPMQAGPTTQWGQHKGLIQFGEPQAKTYGVDFSSPEAALRSQLGADGAIVKYARAHGFKPGEHGPLQLYATINAGDPNKTGASDAGNGGAPGTVADKYYTQMNAHRAKFGGTDFPDPGSPGYRGQRYASRSGIPDSAQMSPEDQKRANRYAALGQLAEGLIQSSAPQQSISRTNYETGQAALDPIQLHAPMAIPEF